MFGTVSNIAASFVLKSKSVFQSFSLSFRVRAASQSLEVTRTSPKDFAIWFVNYRRIETSTGFKQFFITCKICSHRMQK